MKKYLFGIGLMLILSLTRIQAQTTVMDFTKTDCNGIQTNLFQQLDSGYAVILEYVMLPNCSPCITAAKGLKSILQSGNISKPENVKMFQISYNNTTTCATLKSWSNSNGFTNPLFEKGADEVAYYGGMGMPTIVIAGGKSHAIHYQKQGYSPSENSAITMAINNALSQSNGIEKFNLANFKVYPQPAKNIMTIECGHEINAVSLIDMTGKLVLTSNESGKKIEITLNNIPAGIYFIKCKDILGNQIVKKIMID